MDENEAQQEEVMYFYHPIQVVIAFWSIFIERVLVELLMRIPDWPRLGSVWLEGIWLAWVFQTKPRWCGRILHLIIIISHSQAHKSDKKASINRKMEHLPPTDRAPYCTNVSEPLRWRSLWFDYRFHFALGSWCFVQGNTRLPKLGPWSLCKRRPWSHTNSTLMHIFEILPWALRCTRLCSSTVSRKLNWFRFGPSFIRSLFLPFVGTYSLQILSFGKRLENETASVWQMDGERREGGRESEGCLGELHCSSSSSPSRKLGDLP